MKLLRPELIAVLLFVSAMPAQAYIGPGMGAGALAVVFGVLGSILLAFVALLWYPVKRMMRRARGGNGGNGKVQTGS